MKENSHVGSAFPSLLHRLKTEFSLNEAKKKNFEVCFSAQLHFRRQVNGDLNHLVICRIKLDNEQQGCVVSCCVMLCCVVCLHSQAPDVRRHVGGDLQDPDVQLLADVLGSRDQAAVSAGLDLHLRAGHRRRGRLHRRAHQRQDDHHHHGCARSRVKLL